MTKEPLIQLIQKSTDALEKAATTFRAKTPWSKVRTVINQVVECAGFMEIAAITVSNGALPALPMEEMQILRDKALADDYTTEKALATLRASAMALTSALADVSDETLQTSIALPFFGGAQKTIAEFVALICRNTTDHEGQINRISALL